MYPKQNKPQTIKSTENAPLDHRSLLQFLTANLTPRIPPIFVASISSAAPRHFRACWGDVRTWASLCGTGLCGYTQEGTRSSLASYHPCPFTGDAMGTSLEVLAKGRFLGFIGSVRGRRGCALEAVQAVTPKRQRKWCQRVKLAGGCCISCFRNWLWFQQQFLLR